MSTLKLDKSITYYLSGPMSGYPQDNYPAFHEAANRLRDYGFDIVSPAELKVRPGDAYWDWISRDVHMVATKANGIILLPDWQKSRGSRIEVFVGLNNDHCFGVYHPQVHNGAMAVKRSTIMRKLRGTLK